MRLKQKDTLRLQNCPGQRLGLLWELGSNQNRAERNPRLNNTGKMNLHITGQTQHLGKQRQMARKWD